MARRICIVGAGASGLRCATVLLENGFDVTIIEARNRIGGRIAQSDEMGPIPVDIGANWVHSTGYNPIIELAKETETPLHLWLENTLIVDTKGHLVERARGNNALRVVWEILEKAIDYSTNSSQLIDSSASLYDYFVGQSNAMVANGDLNPEDVDLVLNMSQMWGAYVGTRVERQSLKFFFLEDCIGGDDCFIPSNYIEILAKIASKPLAEADIQLNTSMTSIESLGSEEASSTSVKVRLSDGREEHFDAVVVTTPLGWLKKNKAAIRPPVSSRISEAIDSISIGNLEKVLIEFPYSYWEPEQGSDESRISFIHWLSPQYDNEHSPKGWRLECVSFNAFPPKYRRNILLFYTFGDCSVYLTSLTHGKDYAECSVILRDFFEPYYSRLPNYDEKTCSPLRFLATEWSQDQYAGFGSYSNFQVGMENAANDVIELRHGMPERGIYFAGEHTAPFDGLGTVAGAYNAGEAVARRIVGGAKPMNK